MKLCKYILPTLFLLSLLIIVVQQLRINNMYPLTIANDVEVGFHFDVPEFTEREKVLIHAAAPTLLKHSSLLVDKYIGGIKETEDEITFYIFGLCYLQSFSVSLEELTWSGSGPMDYEGPTMVFDKNMNLKKLIPMWGDEVVFNNGKGGDPIK